ncbi:methionyl-tRNA synthetase [Geranomyces variabilis]|uniref:Probable methionine--tRNA ligase, mitochondrial n=1 Tax=Geranomyces variabilis TaxID=109894 RepID=A0AAD5XLB5_9FUNG|nr:methionyl-tRNA synthetase [Geranomyces variabilis]
MSLAPARALQLVHQIGCVTVAARTAHVAATRCLLQALPSVARLHASARCRSEATGSSAALKSPRFVTTPIFYANAVPHIGHLYSTVLADSLKRVYELQGYPTVFSTGTDEHGQKIQQAAEDSAVEPGVFCDGISAKFKALFEAANISYTDYVRTTEPRHKRAVAFLWTELKNRGYIYKGEHAGWYCVSDETFYSQSQVESIIDPKTRQPQMISKESRRPVVWTTEENYMFRLSGFQDKLLHWLEANPEAIIPASQYRDVRNTLRSPLPDLSISRLAKRVSWGIPVPEDPDHVIYVWLDALANYLTVLGYPWTPNNPEPNLRAAWPAHVHVVGKDIVKFHAIYWPAFLMAAGLEPPKRIVSHAHWLMGHEKMSKSKGNVVDPERLLKTYGVDAVRYFLMRDGGIANDADFSERAISQRYKHDLAGQLGNLSLRCVAPRINPTMTATTTPSQSSPYHPAELALLTKLHALPAVVAAHYDAVDFASALETVFDAVAEANRAWVAAEPWKMGPTDPRLRTAVYLAMETVRIAAVAMLPVMPGKMNEMLDNLGVQRDERSWANVGVGKRWAAGPEGKRDVALKADVVPPFPNFKQKK